MSCETGAMFTMQQNASAVGAFPRTHADGFIAPKGMGASISSGLDQLTD